MNYYQDELYHHGIKGQKWGVRRYQNEDGTLTDAGKKRYTNPDGSLNYRGLKKQRKDEINRNPYGKLKKEGGPGRTAEQTNRLNLDRFKYGDKGVGRIKDKMASGKTYSQAKRAENVRAGARAAAGILATVVYMDLMATGGRNTADVASTAVRTGKKVAKHVLNNAAGIFVGNLGIGKKRFDDEMLKRVFD